MRTFTAPNGETITFSDETAELVALVLMDRFDYTEVKPAKKAPKPAPAPPASDD